YSSTLQLLPGICERCKRRCLDAVGFPLLPWLKTWQTHRRMQRLRLSTFSLCTADQHARWLPLWMLVKVSNSNESEQRRLQHFQTTSVQRSRFDGTPLKHGLDHPSAHTPLPSLTAQHRRLPGPGLLAEVEPQQFHCS